jgi:hypothetical protein
LSQEPLAEITMLRPANTRGDFPEPVLGFETQGDIFGLSRDGVPQGDSHNVLGTDNLAQRSQD